MPRTRRVKREFSNTEHLERHGLFSEEDSKSPFVEVLISTSLEETNFVVHKAIKTGDCFFDSCAQALNVARNIREHSLRSLRSLCKDYAAEQETLFPVHKTREERERNISKNWIFQQLQDDRLYQQYLMQVEFSSAEVKLLRERYRVGDGYPVWGEQNIDARIICKCLVVSIHVIEIRENPADKDSFITLHQLVTENGNKNLEEETAKATYKNPNIIHLVVYRNHFVSVLPISAFEDTLQERRERTIDEAEIQEGRQLRHTLEVSRLESHIDVESGEGEAEPQIQLSSQQQMGEPYRIDSLFDVKEWKSTHLEIVLIDDSPTGEVLQGFFEKIKPLKTDPVITHLNIQINTFDALKYRDNLVPLISSGLRCLIIQTKTFGYVNLFFEQYVSGFSKLEILELSAVTYKNHSVTLTQDEVSQRCEDIICLNKEVKQLLSEELPERIRRIKELGIITLKRDFNKYGDAQIKYLYELGKLKDCYEKYRQFDHSLVQRKEFKLIYDLTLECNIYCLVSQGKLDKLNKLNTLVLLEDLNQLYPIGEDQGRLIDQAVNNSNPNIVRWLITHGADPTRLTPITDRHQQYLPQPSNEYSPDLQNFPFKCAFISQQNRDVQEIFLQNEEALYDGLAWLILQNTELRLLREEILPQVSVDLYRPIPKGMFKDFTLWQLIIYYERTELFLEYITDQDPIKIMSMRYPNKIGFKYADWTIFSVVIHSGLRDELKFLLYKSVDIQLESLLDLGELSISQKLVYLLFKGAEHFHKSNREHILHDQRFKEFGRCLKILCKYIQDLHNTKIDDIPLLHFVLQKDIYPIIADRISTFDKERLAQAVEIAEFGNVNPLQLAVLKQNERATEGLISECERCDLLLPVVQMTLASCCGMNLFQCSILYNNFTCFRRILEQREIEIVNTLFSPTHPEYAHWSPIQVIIHLIKRSELPIKFFTSLLEHPELNLNVLYPNNTYLIGLNVLQAIVADISHDPFKRTHPVEKSKKTKDCSVNKHRTYSLMEDVVPFHHSIAEDPAHAEESLLEPIVFSPEIIERVMQRLGEEVNYVCQDRRSKDFYGMTALHITIQDQNVAFSRVLLVSPMTDYTIADARKKTAQSIVSSIHNDELQHLISEAETKHPTHKERYWKRLKYESEVCPSLQVREDKWVISIAREDNSDHCFLIFEGLKKTESETMKAVMWIANIYVPTSSNSWFGKARIEIQSAESEIQVGIGKQTNLLQRIKGKLKLINLKFGTKLFYEQSFVDSKSCLALINSIEEEANKKSGIVYSLFGNRGLFGICSSSRVNNCVSWAMEKYNKIVPNHKKLSPDLSNWSSSFIINARGFLNADFTYIYERDTNDSSEEIIDFLRNSNQRLLKDQEVLLNRQNLQWGFISALSILAILELRSKTQEENFSWMSLIAPIIFGISGFVVSHYCSPRKREYHDEPTRTNSLQLRL